MVALLLRKNVDTLSATELTALQDAYRGMMSILDNRSYNYFAGLHGVPNFYCWHHARSQGSQQAANLFLPWHRAYLLYFEHALRDQNPDVSIPWWDWTSPQSHNTGVPTAFANATVNNQPNPLYQARIYVPTANPPLDRMTRRFPGDPKALPAPSEVDFLVTQLTQFEDFSNQLEDIHDRIHVWTGGNNGTIGGDMGNIATAAFDPIFWSHHCMIDRIWYLWQLKNGVSDIPQQYLSMVLEPFALTVRDVLSISGLGYDYAISSTVIR